MLRWGMPSLFQFRGICTTISVDDLTRTVPFFEEADNNTDNWETEELVPWLPKHWMCLVGFPAPSQMSTLAQKIASLRH
jgi:hypothetical protein